MVIYLPVSAKNTFAGGATSGNGNSALTFAWTATQLTGSAQ
jgi:hypothetical protein